MLGRVLLIIAIILLVVMVVLYFLGKKAQKKKEDRMSIMYLIAGIQIVIEMIVDLLEAL